MSDELALRGHRVVVVAPSSSRALVRDSRRRRARRRARARARARCACWPWARRCRRCPARRRAALPIDVARTISDLFERAALDLCHVHEPFAPSVASTALRHSRALNVGTFHAPTERVVATQVARKVVQLVFGRLDARTADLRERPRDLLRRFFPGEYAIVAPGADPLAAPRARRRRAGAHRLRRAGGARRPAALPARAAPPRPGAALGGGRPLRARPVVLDAAARRPARARALRRRRATRRSAARRRRSSPPPTASRPRPGSSPRAQAAGAVPSPRAWPSTRRRSATARPGCSSSRNDLETLAAQLARLVVDARPARAPARGGAPAAVERGGRRARGRSTATLAARRHGVRGNADDRPRAAEPAH